MSREELDKLQKQVNEFDDDSPEKLAFLEHAVRIADALGDIQKGIRFRLQIAQAAPLVERQEKAFPALSWCLANEAFMDKQTMFLMLWQYVRLITNAPTLYGIKLDEILRLQDSVKTRPISHGYTLRPYYRTCADNAIAFGFLEESKNSRNKWKASIRGPMANCKACDQLSLVEDHFVDGDFSRARVAARPILSGKLTSCGVPATSHAILLAAFLICSDIRRAGRHYDVGLPLAMKGKDYRSIRWHLCYLTRIGDIARGMRLVERYLPLVCRTNPWLRMKFNSLVADYFERLSEARPQLRKVRLPDTLSIYNDEGRYAPADLADWFRVESDNLARAFDNRNGNNYVSWELARDRALGLALPIPEYPRMRQSIDEVVDHESGKKAPPDSRRTKMPEKKP